MEIVKTMQLSPAQFSQLSEMWNEEYPLNLKDRFALLIDEGSNIRHYIINDEYENIRAWAMLFDKDDETRFSIIVKKENQGEGLGKSLIRALQNDCNSFNGWVIDHNNDLKSDGTHYLTPLDFYRKIGFKVSHDVRIDTDIIQCVKVHWSSHQETFTTWNNIAQLYEEKFMPMQYYNQSYDLFCNLLPKSTCSLLELGCGPGNISKYILDRHSNIQLHGIDIAPNMIDLAIKNNPAATFQVMDIRNIHSIPKKFNGIIGGFCLPYLNQKEADQLFADCRALLHDYGIIYMSFVEGEYHQSEYKTGSGGRVFFNYHPLEGLIGQMQSNGFYNFETLKVEYPLKDNATEIHTIIIAEKSGQ
ncbi:MAG: GNAT family N-acetyltransferase [Flavobacteriales bacterium]